jgi:hypothetical protein
MNFDIFDENFYRLANPDVEEAIKQGIFTSGLEHFQKFGLQEGRIGISPFYNENTYLENNRDVAEALQAGVFKNGLEHFIKFGFEEGRLAISFYAEATYLRLNTDVAEAVKSGIFKSGFQHFIQRGLAEGRSLLFFNENAYRSQNPDVTWGVEKGAWKSGFDYYTKYGAFGNPDRMVYWTGTQENDVIRNVGDSSSTIYGVNGDFVTGFRTFYYQPTSFGEGEVDTLVGGFGKDEFMLGRYNIISDGNPYIFYLGGGSNDYALIQNFEVGKDMVLLGGSESEYKIEPTNGSLNISTSSGDLVAIVEGVQALTVNSTDVGGFGLS